MRYEVGVRGSGVAWIACLIILLPTGAEAQGPGGGGVSFSWVRGDGAQSCPGRAELAAEVARRLGYDPFQPAFGQSLEGVVERTSDRWQVVLYARDAEGVMVGRRELDSEEQGCAALGDAVALAMALAIDPEAALRAPASEPEP